jgi:hypothetical protein
VRTAIQRARQLKASRDGVEALRTYRLVQTVGGDAPEDGMPIPDVPHAYHQTWESLNTAIDQLRRAQQEFDDKNFEVAQRLLNSYQRQMGDATGPFVNTLTGHVTQVQVSPASLRQQIEERLRVPIISLAFASSDLTERQLDRFRKQIADGLRQNGYTVTINNNGSGLKVRGELKVIKADVGTLVTINLTATLTFSNQKRVDKIRVHTGPQISTSEDEALHTAIQLSLTKCAAVVEEWVEKVRS